jgi:AbrB family looped-hinge helix DNA binding protein
MKTTSRSDTVSFTTKGQVVIPAHVRREFQIEDGTRAAVTITSEGILLRPITRDYIRSLRGSLKGKGVMKALAADRKQERAV